MCIRDRNKDWTKCYSKPYCYESKNIDYDEKNKSKGKHESNGQSYSYHKKVVNDGFRIVCVIQEVLNLKNTHS